MFCLLIAGCSKGQSSFSDSSFSEAEISSSHESSSAQESSSSEIEESSSEIESSSSNQDSSEEITYYTLSFEIFGGTEIAPITKEAGSLIDKPSQEPILKNKKFIGWCYDKELTQQVVWPHELVKNTTFYASYNDVVDIGEYLEALLDGYSFNPYSFIPEVFQPTYSENLVDESDIAYDFTSFIQTSSIIDYGWGEQWKMVIDNLEQSMLFFDYLSLIDSLVSSSIAAFNNYLDSNPGTTANYQFALGEYNIFIDFDGTIMRYVLETQITNFTQQIALSLNIVTGEKEGRIQLSDANALRYVVSENSYSFAIRYLGIRRAYFNVTRSANNVVTGEIFEYLGIDNSVTTSSCAQFIIDQDYLTVVGNKAGGMIGFTGTICELYDTDNGHLLGYEVNETLSVGGLSAEYDTLWFNLSDTTGIESIKVTDKVEEDDNASNVNSVYINDSDELFQITTYGGLGTKMFSRRYDIELRTRYYTYFDSTQDAYVVANCSIPMLFVQEEKLEDLKSDIEDANKNLNFELTISTVVIEQLIANYDKYLPIFNDAKDRITTDYILDFIGTAISFE